MCRGLDTREVWTILISIMGIQMSKRQIFLIIAIAVGILLLIILAKKMGTVTDQPVLRGKSRHKRIREEREIRRLNAKSLDIRAGGHRITVDVGIYRRENGRWA
jgi:hypothetical protein